MYRCQQCNTVVGPGRKMNRVVIETRPKTYTLVRMVDPRKKGLPSVREHIGVASGHETAKELETCADCARKLEEARLS